MKATSIFLCLALFVLPLLFGNQLSAAENPPIDLMEFDVQLDTRNVIINWVTAEELTTDVFHIERSLDGINFSIVGTVEAAGNSSVEIKYFYMDVLQLGISGNVYFRFTQVDLDGMTSTSNTKSVIAPMSNIPTPVFVNPIAVDLTHLAGITIHQGTNPLPLIQIFDINGKLVHFKKQKLDGKIDIPQDLPKGHYIVNVRNQNMRLTTRFIKA